MPLSRTSTSTPCVVISEGSGFNPICAAVSELIIVLCTPGLLELAPSYFDIGSFPDGETKRALLRLLNKKSSNLKADGRRPKTPNGEIRPAKKLCKQ